MSKAEGRVYIVGAGCGDADLITVRGQNLIENSDVIVYDDLISPNLLTLARDDAEIIYMGKRSGRHSASQEEINRTLIELAHQGKTVCRLKGGDPFVFGRGGEEILALRAEGIAFEEVPGISSAIAIPASAGIPVTHRKLSRSFHVITAHSADTEDGLPADMDTYAKLSGTLIFLMGLSKLERICDRLILAGKSKDTPAAVISGGNSAHPATVRGTLETLPEQARRAQVQTPAVIVVGETAALDLKSSEALPLAGVSVGITGTDRMTRRLTKLLSALGARSIVVERSRLTEKHPKLDSNAFDEKSWIVFTSANGVRRFFRVLRENGMDIRDLAACRFAVIGKATFDELYSFGIRADYCPEEYTGKALAEGLARRILPGERVFLLRSEEGDRALYDTLSGLVPTEDIFTYGVEPDMRVCAAAKEYTESLDYLTFSSAGGVRLYFETVGRIAERTKCVCIGAPTADALRRYGVEPAAVSDAISAEGIVEAVCRLAQDE